MGNSKTIISENGKFEWDSAKDKLNVKNHGLSFSEVLGVFDDPYLLTRFDSKHSSLEEERYISVGSIQGILVVVVSHTERNGRTRIISARRAEPKLKGAYENYVKQING